MKRARDTAEHVAEASAASAPAPAPAPATGGQLLAQPPTDAAWLDSLQRSPVSSRAHVVEHLQRGGGNAAVGRVLARKEKEPPTVEEAILKEILGDKQPEKLRELFESVPPEKARHLVTVRLRPGSKDALAIRFRADLPQELCTELLEILRRKYEPQSAKQEPAEPAPAGPAGPSAPAAGGYVAHKYCRKDPPPNTAVVEDEATCEALLKKCEAGLAAQRARANSMLVTPRGPVKDFRYFFARVYSYVTENEIAFVRAAAYYYPSYVLRSVLYFEKIYEDNFNAWDANKGGDKSANPEDHWRIAFERTAAAQQSSESLQKAAEEYEPIAGEPGDRAAKAGMLMSALANTVLESTVALTESMKAHIRFDLPRAEAWVFNTHYANMPGVKQKDFEADFMSMSGVFDNAARAMQTDMSHKLGAPLGLVPQLIQDSSMRHWFNADMATERADTWQRGLDIGPTAGKGPYSAGPGGAPVGDVTKGGPHLGGLDALPGAQAPSMDASQEKLAHPNWYDLRADDEARDEVARLGVSGLQGMPSIPRVQLIRSMLSVSATGDDEKAILKVLEASVAKGDAVVVIDAADAWDLMYSFDGSEAEDLRKLLRKHYYAKTARVTAFRLMQKCLDGESAEWEEEMVADILDARGDVRGLVEDVGKTYGIPDGLQGKADAALLAGVNKLEWQLDGEDEDRMRAALRARGLPDHSGYTFSP